MQVAVTLELSDVEKTELAGILECAPADLPGRLAGFGAAALEEYVRMILGQKVFKRGSDFLEYRLYLLIQHAMNKRIPGEPEISKLFQTTATESRGFTRAVMSKYQYPLQSIVTASLKSVLEKATKAGDADHYSLTLNGVSFVEALNRELAGMDGSLPQIAKKKGTVAEYEIAASSYEKLREKFQ